jgi:hypothetical protein
MPEFRTGTRKDGSTYHYPVSGRSGGRYSTPSIETRRVSWGRYGQRDIQRERDSIPDCNPDSDLGWLPAMERDLDREFDEKERDKLLELMRTVKYGSDEEAAISLAMLEKEYPDVFEFFTGDVADMP